MCYKGYYLLTLIVSRNCRKTCHYYYNTTRRLTKTTINKTLNKYKMKEIYYQCLYKFC